MRSLFSPIPSAFEKYAHGKVYSRRFSYSVVLMVLAEVLILDVFLLVLKLVSWHPLLGIQDWFSCMFSFWSAMYHLASCICSAVFAVSHMVAHKVEPYVFQTRWEGIRFALSEETLLQTLVLSISGAVNVFCYTGHIRTAVSIQKNAYFLERIFPVEDPYDLAFLISGGVFMGGLFSWKYYTRDWYLLRFSLIQQWKFTFWSSKLKQVFEDSFLDVLKYMPYNLFFYFLCCPAVMHLLSFATGRAENIDRCFQPMWKIKLIPCLLLIVTVMHFSWVVCLEIFNTVMTQRLEFPLEPYDRKGKGEKPENLIETICCPHSKVMQYLAFLDLRWLAQFSPQRRKVFYSISQPGGHPHHWNNLSAVSVNKLEKFIEDLYIVIVAEKTIGPKPSVKPVRKKNAGSSSPSPINGLTLRETQIFKFFLDEQPEAKAIKLFSACQTEIWTIEALGFFIAASYTEDKFGVVQQTLPDLLQLLVSLKLHEDKIPVGVTGSRKYGKDSFLVQRATALQWNLKAAVESALYRIVLAFKTDIRNIPLADEYKRFLEKYLEFKQ